MRYPAGLPADTDTGFLVVPSGEEGARVMRRLLGQLQTRTLRALLLNLRPDHARCDRLVAGAGTGVERMLLNLLSSHGAAMRMAASRPEVQTPLRMSAAGRLPTAEAVNRALPAFLLDLYQQNVLRVGLRLPLLVPLQGTPLVDSVSGVAFRAQPAQLLRLGPDGVGIEQPGAGPIPWGDGAQFEQALHPLTPRSPLRLCTVDTNPLWHMQDHPDASPNAVDLGGVSVAQWCSRLADALRFIEQGLPSWHHELRYTLQRIVPVGVEPERHRSASFQDAPGVAYMSLHPDPLVMAEAIVHETQHSKLHVLRYTDPLMLNGAADWTHSPVRPDLRPLDGILLAAHAFVPVALMYQRLLSSGVEVPERTRFELRYARVLAGNTNALRILRTRAQWTRAGRRVFSALRAIHAHTVEHAPALPDRPELADLLPPG